jgi:hypothetical protein
MTPRHPRLTSWMSSLRLLPPAPALPGPSRDLNGTPRMVVKEDREPNPETGRSSDPLARLRSGENPAESEFQQ